MREPLAALQDPPPTPPPTLAVAVKQEAPEGGLGAEESSSLKVADAATAAGGAGEVGESGGGEIAMQVDALEVKPEALASGEYTTIAMM